MNCRNFETVITELARNMILEAGARQNALAHLEKCSRCSARLKDEQTLTAGLRAVALSMEAAQAPSGVETALLAAFRQRGVTTQAPAAVHAPLKTRAWLAWSMAAAAAIVVATLISLSGLLFADSPGPVQRASNNVQPSVPSYTTPAEEAAPVPDTINEMAESGERPEGVQETAPAADRRRPGMRTVALSSKRFRGPGNLQPSPKADEEITTEFVPLTYANLSQLDEGQVVRVELPRSTLQSFGLPVSVDRPGERVKADVLLGHDGVARAIRLVR